MSKNIVVCCDGTWNRFDKAQNTNVVKLASCLIRDSARQVVFYDPGVGTIAAERFRSRIGRAWSKLLGGAFGFGLRKNLEEAYTFIADHYETDDRIYLFGFSRGAYTARALAAVIRHLGLLESGNDNLYQYMNDIFARRVKDPKDPKRLAPDFELYARFRNTFSRNARVHFVGVWDTVSSVGWLTSPVVIPSTAANPIVSHIRHAVSIDERRKNFSQNLFKKATDDQDLKEVWFPGVHADVGGGYEEQDSGLSKLSLAWMLREAAAQGLLLDDARRKRVLGLDNDKYAPASATATLHDPFEKLGWRLAQFLPRRSVRKREDASGYEVYEQYWNWSSKGAPRKIPAGATLHESVLARLNNDAAYRPANILNPSAHSIENGGGGYGGGGMAAGERVGRL